MEHYRAVEKNKASVCAQIYHDLQNTLSNEK